MCSKNKKMTCPKKENRTILYVLIVTETEYRVSNIYYAEQYGGHWLLFIVGGVHGVG